MVIKSLSDRQKHGQMVIEFVSQHRQGQLIIKAAKWSLIVTFTDLSGAKCWSSN
jgi:hypothetical protein